MDLFNSLVEEDRFSSLDNDSFHKVISSQTNYVLVAEEDSRLIGFITASSRLVVRYTRPIMQVDEFYVEARFRRHGVGTKLIEALEKLALQNNFFRIYIESHYKHELGHRFYEKSGYTKSGYYFQKTL
jgi:GNAT superfamily N-acetyltransferase